MRTIIISIFIFAFTSPNIFSQLPDWYSKIKELKIPSSSKLDVIRVFGLEKVFSFNPEYYPRSQWYFDFDGGSIEANFWDHGPCHGIRSDRHGIMFWNVPDDTLTGISFSTGKNNISPDQLPFSIAGFETWDEYKPQVTYASREQGIHVEVDNPKRVRSIWFGPSSSMDYMLCPSDPNRLGLLEFIIFSRFWDVGWSRSKLLIRK